MDKQKHKLISEPLKSLKQDKLFTKKQFLLGSILATLIAGSPFLFYLYNYVPSSPNWDTVLFSYHSGFYENAQTAMWMLTGKIVPLIFLIIWFFTCRHWWFHALIVPIAMYIYQIIIAIHEDTTTGLDEVELIYMVPIMALIIPSIYLVRARVFTKINDADKTLQELEDEFKIRPTSLLGKLKEFF